MVEACSESHLDPAWERYCVIDDIVDLLDARLGTAATYIGNESGGGLWVSTVALLGYIGVEGVNGSGRWAGVSMGVVAQTRFENGYRSADVGIGSVNFSQGYILAAPDPRVAYEGVTQTTARRDRTIRLLLAHTEFDPDRAQAYVRELAWASMIGQALAGDMPPPHRDLIESRLA